MLKRSYHIAPNKPTHDTKEVSMSVTINLFIFFECLSIVLKKSEEKD